MNHAEARRILGLEAGADKDAIKAAYRRKAMQTHPDRGGKEEDFKRVGEAYETLQSPEKVSPYARTGSSYGGFEDAFNDVFKNAFKSGYGDDAWARAEAKAKKDKENAYYKSYETPQPRVVQFNCAIDEAFGGIRKKINIDGLGVRNVKVPSGALDNQVVEIIKENGFTYMIHVRIVAPEGMVVDWGKTTPSDIGNLTMQFNVSPFLLITGGYAEAQMVDGTTVKVYIPPGTKANTLLKVKDKGYWKDATRFMRGHCLLRVIPEIKRIAEYDLKSILDFQEAVHKNWAEHLPAKDAQMLLTVLIKELTAAFGITLKPEDFAKPDSEAEPENDAS